MSSEPTPPAEDFKRPLRTSNVGFHLTKDEKVRLQRAAFDDDRSMSKFIVRALEKSLPEIFVNGEER